MLTIQKQPQYLRKTVRLPNGSLALVVFELQGNTWKAVYGEIIQANVATEKKVCLPVSIEKLNIEPITSPYFSEVKNFIKDFAFVISQPSRAPDFI
jgi:hypothetical protein